MKAGVDAVPILRADRTFWPSAEWEETLEASNGIGAHLMQSLQDIIMLHAASMAAGFSVEAGSSGHGEKRFLSRLTFRYYLRTCLLIREWILLPS